MWDTPAFERIELLSLGTFNPLSLARHLATGNAINLVMDGMIKSHRERVTK